MASRRSLPKDYDRFQTRRILFVGNHRSNLDTFLLISFIPGLRGLAKSSLFQNIFFAPYMWLCGFIPVDKGSLNSLAQGLKLLKSKLLLKDRAVLAFPETTRCKKDFKGVGKFGASFFSLAIESEATIVPFVFKGTDQLMGKGDFFINPFQPVTLTLLEPIKAADFQNPRELRDLVWSQIHEAYNDL